MAAGVVLLHDALRELNAGDENAERPQARVITGAQRPYQIMQVNQAWTALCGFSSQEAVGNTFAIMQGPATNGRSLVEMHKRLGCRRPNAQLILNYKKDGSPFLNLLQVIDVLCFASQLAHTEREGGRERARACARALAVAPTQEISPCLCARARERAFLPPVDHPDNLSLWCVAEQVCPIYDDTGEHITHFLGQLEDIGHRDARVSRGRLVRMGWGPEICVQPRMELGAAMEAGKNALVVTEVRSPHRIVHVNKAWEILCGIRADEALGNTLSIVQGDATNAQSLRQLNAKIMDGVPCSTIVLNYKGGGEPFINYLQVSAVVDHRGCVTHLVGQLEDLTLKEPELERQTLSGGVSRLDASTTVYGSVLPAQVAVSARGDEWGGASLHCYSAEGSSRERGEDSAFYSAGGSASEVLVGLSTPVKVLKASTAFLDLFQLTSAGCVGRTLALLAGPQTDSVRMIHMIEAAACGHESRSTLVLYSQNGLSDFYHVQSKPFGNPLNPTGCLLAFTTAHSLTFNTAMKDDGSVKALLDAESFRAVQVSSAFEETYGLSSSVVTGRTLNLIHGPSTDLRAWQSMLSTSSKGKRTKGFLVTVTRQCVDVLSEVDFCPVLNQHGYVSHVLVTMSALWSAGTGRESEASCDKSSGMKRSLDLNALEGSRMQGIDDVAQVQAPKFSQHSRARVQEAYTPPQDQMKGLSSLQSCMQALPEFHAEYQDDPMAARRFDGTLIEKRCGSSLAHDQHTMAKACNTSSMSESLRMVSGHTSISRHAARDRTCGDITFESLDPANASPCCVESPGESMASFDSLASFGSNQYSDKNHQNGGKMSLDEGGRSNRMAVSKVVPRRKPGQSLEQTRAVCITLEVLARFSNMPLAKAAIALGISPTAMKKACRKLGVTRWPHSTATPGAIDGAYVRRIQRKHQSKKVKDVAATHDTAALHETVAPHDMGSHVDTDIVAHSDAEWLCAQPDAGGFLVADSCLDDDAISPV